MNTTATPSSSTRRAMLRFVQGALPFVVLIVAWILAPRFLSYPAYVLPSIDSVAQRVVDTTLDLSLPTYTALSLLRLFSGLVIGIAISVPLAVAIALNRHVSDLMLPLLAFLQSIAGIAWIPLAIIWFGIGNGAVVFVIANIIFFSMIYNTVLGIQSIPLTLRRAVRAHGGSGLQMLTELIIPGALVQIILGLRTLVHGDQFDLTDVSMRSGAAEQL